MRVSDYIFDFLAKNGARHVFMVSGGGAMHLDDAIGRNPALTYTCNHHEQASAMAAEGWARVTGEPGIVCVTAGPGGINALNGVFGAFTDSIPMIVLSGQVKRETSLKTHGLTGRLRQLGDQEVDIVEMVRPITKYAVMVTDPSSIRYHMEKAWHLARTGRPGPCWIDVPVDVQGSQVDPDSMTPWNPAEEIEPWKNTNLAGVCEEIRSRLQASRRPVIMAGSGVRISGMIPEFKKLVSQLGIPVVTAWTHDVIETEDPHFCGRPGSIGDRAGNFCVQNSDFLLVLGSRLNIRQVSYNWSFFAREAFKIQVDVDPAELDKPMVRPDLPVCADLRDFLPALQGVLADFQATEDQRNWLAWCKERVRKYPVFQPDRQVHPGPLINPYHFATVLFEELEGDDVIACGDATATIVTFQCAKIRGNLQVFSNSGAASMGHDLPAAIGAAVARKGGRVICLAGDGSLQMNIQELQTVVHEQLPIKLFVLNNEGYLSIKQTQKNFFGLEVGASPTSGVSFPDHQKLGDAYGIPSHRMEGPDIRTLLRKVLDTPGPVLCEVMLDPAQAFEPKLTSRRLPDGRMVSSPLEDMAPFLSREELATNMLVPPPKE